MMGLMDMKPNEENDEACPDSWEMADLEASMKRLMPAGASPQGDGFAGDRTTFGDVQVDEFLREALQNPHDRLTILRLEQEVERFVKNPTLQQLEFPPMASSYMRLAAHRVAQHYYLLTSVLDSNAGEGCRIIVRKSGESSRLPVRLADIPVAAEGDNTSNLKFVIKQRPQANFMSAGDAGARGDGCGSSGSGSSFSKTVEERNEEYNKARARIFRHEMEQNALQEERQQETKKSYPKPADVPDHGIASTKRAGKTDKDHSAKSRQKVAIFRDREKDRKDPDYDRTYDRYSQRFDPGFGLSQPAFGMQARYTPVVNYNTEFPQLGCPPVRQISPGAQPAQAWGGPAYQPQDMLRAPAPFSHPRGVAPPNMTTYMSQYPYARASMSYAYPSQVSQPENSSTQARRQ